jgi:hypothetical protein
LPLCQTFKDSSPATLAPRARFVAGKAANSIPEQTRFSGIPFKLAALGNTAMALIDQSKHGFEAAFHPASKSLVVVTILFAVGAVSFLLLETLFT